MATIVVGTLSDFGSDDRIYVEHKGRRIAVFRIDGDLVAIRDYCPHHGAPVCAGVVSGTFEASAPQTLEYGREGRILTCPAHHWQFDLRSGDCLTHARLRLKTYPVSVEQGEVLVHV